MTNDQLQRKSRITTQSAMDKKQCCECKSEINESEPLFCGFCEAYLHISQQCCGFNARGLRDAFASRKVLVICSTCRDELNGRSISSYAAKTPQSQSSDLPNLNVKFQQLCGIVEALSNKFDDFVSKPKPPLATPSLGDTPIWPRRSVKRRRDERQSPIQTAPVYGTKDISLSDLSVPSILSAVVPNKFWLYLSGVNPLATNSDVQKIVSRCLDVPDSVDVVRLVPRDKDVASLTFVSFKVGLDPELKNRALDPASWPTGLLFREFVDQPKTGLRRPRMLDQMN